MGSRSAVPQELSPLVDSRGTLEGLGSTLSRFTGSTLRSEGMASRLCLALTIYVFIKIRKA